MVWLNARPAGSEVARTNEEYTVGEHESGKILPRGLALEDSPTTASMEYWDGAAWQPMTEVTDPVAVLGATEFRVLYDPNQALGGAWETGAADTTAVRIDYMDRGHLVWAHDMDRVDDGSFDGGTASTPAGASFDGGSA